MVEYDQHVCVRDRILPLMKIQGYPMGIPPNATLHTVDGSEIRRSPVEVGRKYPIIYKILYIQTVVGLGISSTHSSTWKISRNPNGFWIVFQPS